MWSWPQAERDCNLSQSDFIKSLVKCLGSEVPPKNDWGEVSGGELSKSWEGVLKFRGIFEGKCMTQILQGIKVG
jgi:hypothetical protein